MFPLLIEKKREKIVKQPVSAAKTCIDRSEKQTRVCHMFQFFFKRNDVKKRRRLNENFVFLSRSRLVIEFRLKKKKKKRNLFFCE